jgi:hypothetical protein
MAEIHVQTAEGKDVVYPEEEIPELLRQGALSSELYYWREGMTKWRPLSRFRPSNQAVVPGRRTDVLPDLADLADRPRSVERPLPARADRSPRRSRKFRFRRRPEGITLVVQAFLVALLVLTAGELALAVIGLGKSGAIDSGSTPTHLRLPLGWINLGLNFVFLIFYCSWVYRAALNSHGFSSIATFKPKWAVGCHFVPVMNLIRPYQAMQEFWRVSGNPRGWQNDPPSSLVTWWWTFALLTLGLAEASFFVSDRATSAVDLKNAALVFLGLKAAQLIWYSLFLVMVTLIVRRQIALADSSSSRGGKNQPAP